jgi:hypothetical protein
LNDFRSFDRKELPRLVASTLATLFPIYLVERLTNYYYFTGDKGIYFTLSGLRTELFIALILIGSITAGILLHDLWHAVLTQTIAILTMLSLVNAFCNPRVCYSAGPDGLEPLRLGLFLGSIAVLGAAVGVSVHGTASRSREASLLISFAAFFALAYYPVIFTFAGTKLLPPYHPWAVSLLLALLSYSLAVTVSDRFGKFVGFAPLAFLGFLMAVSVGISSAYLSDLAQDILIMVLGSVSGTILGVVTSTRKESVRRHQRTFPRLLGVVLVMVIAMTLILIPDAVNQLTPQGEAYQSSSFAMGAPVYAGGYMEGTANGTAGVATTVSFAGTNSTSIQTGNYLSAGLGVHSPDCCVDGIDYAYRFDIYLYHDGNESLLASAWQVCDANAACGGHSWKLLLFTKAGPLGMSNDNSPVRLQLEWRNHTVDWSYGTSQGSMTEFASFEAPAKENPAFNIGVLRTDSSVNQQRAAYFFQFGIASRYAMGHGGWTVAFSCPSTLDGVWTCTNNVRTIQGGASYWKVLWKWGEDYPNVVAATLGNHAFSLGYSPTSTMTNFQPLIND